MTSTPGPGGIANLAPLNRAREQRAWYFYDWANSAFSTTVITVFLGPFLTTVTELAAGCELGVKVATLRAATGDGTAFYEVTLRGLATLGEGGSACSSESDTAA